MKTLLLAVCIAVAPIALTPAFGAGEDAFKPAVTEDADYKRGKAALDKEDWKAAISAMSNAARKYRDEAAVFNWLGYAYRKSGDLDRAFQNYNMALRLDPKHRGAHEYIGEAYLLKKDVASAEKHLKTLEGLCSKTCEEYQDLEKAIVAFKAKGS
ncbi:MAG: tetratricopeptide repeat protein [Burkholderiales bacterium]